MAAGPEFPAFIKLQTQTDGAAERDFVSAIDSMLNKGRRKLAEFSADAQRNLETALAIPRNKTGSLDLGLDEMRQALQAQQARAAAAREVAGALTTTAREEKIYTDAMRQQIAAARQVAASEEALEQQLRQKIAVMDQVQERLNRQVASTDQIVAANNQGTNAYGAMTNSVRANRVAMVQLGQQMQDVVIQSQMGTSAITIFTQQVPQAAFALSGMSGAVGRVASFLSGPWGAAIFAGTALMAPFIARLWEGKDAADAKGAAIDRLTDRLDINKNSYDTLIAVVNEYDKAQRKSTALTYAAIVAAEKLAEANLKAAKSEIAKYNAAVLSGPTGPNGQGQFAASIVVNQLDSKIAQLEKDLTKTRIAGADERAKVATDPRYGIQVGFEQKIIQLRERASKGLITSNQYEAEKVKLINQQTAALEKFDQKNKKTRSPGSRKTDAERAAEKAEKEAARKLKEDQRDTARNVDDMDRSRENIERMVQEQERQLEIQGLLAQGRIEEADALQVQFRVMDALGIKSKDLLDTALEMVGIRRSDYDWLLKSVGLEREKQRLVDEANRKRQEQLSNIDGIRGATVGLFADLPSQGFGAFAGFAKRIQQMFEESLARELVDGIFGNAFLDLEDEVMKTKRREIEQITQTNTALGALEKAANRAASAIDGTVPANDNAAGSDMKDVAEIVVEGNKKTFTSTREFFRGAISKLGEAVFGKEAAGRIGKTIGKVMEGSYYGRVGSSLTGGNSTGGAIGGMLGESVFKAVAPKLFAKLGSFAGPLGSIAGGIIGGLVGKLFGGGAKWGTAVVGGSAGGNNQQARGNVTSAAGSVSDAVNRLAEQLGGTVGGYKVSIGQMDGKWRVSTTGRTGKLENKYSDVTNFGTEGAEAALRFAISDAIKDGAIQGISASAQRLLTKYASDVEKAVEKVLSFENVFKRLKAYKDPVGAALDDLNKQFEGLKKTFQEAGASAEEYAKLEELYGIERARVIKETTAQVAGSLKSLLDDLLIGDNGLSLRERRSNALAQFNPLSERVKAGDITAFEDYATAARALLDIERQISGSQKGYFDLFGDITSTSKKAMEDQQKIADAAINGSSPFTASPTPANDNSGVVGAIRGMEGTLAEILRAQLGAVNQNLGALINQNTFANNMPAYWPGAAVAYF